MISAAVAQHRLDVNHRRAVDGFEWRDLQLAPGDPQNGHAVQPEGIRPVRRPRREDSRERNALVRSRVHLQNVASGLVKPRDEDDFGGGPEFLADLTMLRNRIFGSPFYLFGFYLVEAT